MHHNQSLIVILIVALFSLASLQGLNLILNRQNSVLGETTVLYRCCSDRSCTLNCSYRTNPCSVGTYSCSGVAPQPVVSIGYTQPNFPTPTPPPIVSTKTVPCEEITRLQRQYCPVVTTMPTPYVTKYITPTVRPTPTVSNQITSKMIRPNGGETLYTNKSNVITWEQSDISPETSLELYIRTPNQGDQVLYMIASSNPGSIYNLPHQKGINNYSWTKDPNLPLDTTLKYVMAAVIRNSAGAVTYMDKSDNVFTFIQSMPSPTLRLTPTSVGISR